ncbi:MAG: glutamine cyclotransferase [Blastocatellia bacterium]|nr:MAG: glutamine cyclotransferase [Blastocatellia bacterium]
MNRLALLTLFLLSLSFSNCNSNPTPGKSTNSAVNESPKHLTYEVVKVYPHDPDAFTQGLEVHNGKMIESTGEVGRSSLRSVEVETGDVKKKVEVPPPYFAEGITELNGKIYQLTWQHQVGFIYDDNFQKTGQFNYEGEGWGLTNDGHSLILSDGSNRIKFLDPDSFRVTKTIAVLDGKTPVKELNELEYINGDIYANVWHADRIAVIEPASGHVKAWLDMTGLLQPGDVTDEEAVLNGIAYDQSSNRLFVTGKLWPKMFEIRVK